MGYELNGCATGSVPMYIIEPLIKAVDIPVFCETGTASGDSARESAKHFKKVFTIELIENRQTKDESKNITWLTGNSVDVLPEVIKNLNKNEFCLFWLDAHYSDPTPNESQFKECYIIEELKIIREQFGDKAIIFIDDARLFYGHPPAPADPRDWPVLGEIFKELNQFEFHINTVRDDYILSYPDTLQDPLNEEWRSRYHIRYPNAADKLKSEVKSVYSALHNYIGLS